MNKNLSIKEKQKEFLEIWKQANKKYGKNKKRLAGEGWKKDWQLLITTMLSAQSRDEITIPVAEALFKKYKTLNEIANATKEELKEDIKKINYNETKAKHIKQTTQILLEKHKGKVPRTKEELIKMPGIGIKTANLVLAELYDEQEICVDTHVHRIANVFELVKTKTPEQTEKELKKIVPKKYRNKINRIFVLWGQEVKGKNPEKFLEKLKEKN
ncbi:endonuclease III [Candidatus Woesearchaeota archaeon]|nr:endonuclease III [Candidatus Woesearchaeota archaeon]